MSRKSKKAKVLHQLSEEDDLGRTITVFSSTLFNYYLRREMSKRIQALENKQLQRNRKLRKTMNSRISESDNVLQDLSPNGVENHFNSLSPLFTDTVSESPIPSENSSQKMDVSGHKPTEPVFPSNKTTQAECADSTPFSSL